MPSCCEQQNETLCLRYRYRIVSNRARVPEPVEEPHFIAVPVTHHPEKYSYTAHAVMASVMQSGTPHIALCYIHSRYSQVWSCVPHSQIHTYGTVSVLKNVIFSIRTVNNTKSVYLAFAMHGLQNQFLLLDSLTKPTHFKMEPE